MANHNSGSSSGNGQRKQRHANNAQEARGYGSVAVTDTGALGGKLLGLVTTRDYDFLSDLSTPLGEVMTRDLRTANAGQRLFLSFFFCLKCSSLDQTPSVAQGAPHSPRILREPSGASRGLFLVLGRTKKGGQGRIGERRAGRVFPPVRS